MIMRRRTPSRRGSEEAWITSGRAVVEASLWDVDAGDPACSRDTDDEDDDGEEAIGPGASPQRPLMAPLVAGLAKLARLEAKAWWTLGTPPRPRVQVGGKAQGTRPAEVREVASLGSVGGRHFCLFARFGVQRLRREQRWLREL